MMKTLTLSIASCAATVGLMALAAAPIVQVQDDPTLPTEERAQIQHEAPAAAAASDLVGLEVLGPSEAKLGTTTDLIIEEDGRLLALVKGTDRILRGIPLDRIEAVAGAPEAARPVQVLKTAIDSMTFQQAPTAMRTEDIDTSWLERTRSHYASASEAGGHGTNDTDTDTNSGHTDGGDPRSDGAGAEIGDDRALCLEEMRGTAVRDSENEDVGAFDDLAVNLKEAKVAYAVISANHELGIAETLHGVPWSELSFDREREVIISRFDRTALEKAPEVDKRSLSLDPDLRVSATDGVGERYAASTASR